MSKISDRVMRAKMEVQSVERHDACEVLRMNAVCADHFGEDGLDENNTFARFTPTAEVSMTICNPALFGEINPGERFYVDFTRAPDRAN